jgi:hypothetical protein
MNSYRASPTVLHQVHQSMKTNVLSKCTPTYFTHILTQCTGQR